MTRPSNARSHTGLRQLINRKTTTCKVSERRKFNPEGDRSPDCQLCDATRPATAVLYPRMRRLHKVRWSGRGIFQGIRPAEIKENAKPQSGHRMPRARFEHGNSAHEAVHSIGSVLIWQRYATDTTGRNSSDGGSENQYSSRLDPYSSKGTSNRHPSYTF